MRFLGYVARSESQTNYGFFQYNFIFLMTESSPITLSGISGIEYESVELGFFYIRKIYKLLQCILQSHFLRV